MLSSSFNRLFLAAGLAATALVASSGGVQPVMAQTTPHLSAFAESSVRSAHTRLVLVLPPQLEPTASFTVVFAPAFSLNPYPRAVTLCRLAVRGVELRQIHRCQRTIPAAISVRSGVGSDRLVVTLAEPLRHGADAPVGIALRLINPDMLGTYRIDLLTRSVVAKGRSSAVDLPAGHWDLRVEMPDFDD